MKRTLASALAVLLAASSFGPGAAQAVAAEIAEIRAQAGIRTGPIVGVQLGGLNVAPLNVQTQGLDALGRLPSLQTPEIPALAAPLAAATVSAEAALPTAVQAQLSRAAAPALAAQARAENPASANNALNQAAETRLGPAEAGGESSRGAAESSFSQLHGERLIRASGEVSEPSAVRAAGTGSFQKTLSPASPSAPKVHPEPAAPENAGGGGGEGPRRGSSTLKKALIGGASVLGAVGLAAAASLLVPHAAVVGAIGSVVLSVIGLPQIYKNFKHPEAVKDLVVASPLIWFAAATLLSVVSLGNGASMAWNAANIAGVVESATVVAQINAQKRDKKDLKATAITAAAVIAPVALIATQAFMPLKAGVDLAFTAAMGLLWVLNWPQIRQNYKLYKAEGRAPHGISPAWPGLVAGGSLLHLFAALAAHDYHWALNAIIAIVTSGAVLAQIYFPKAANAVVGPLAKLQDSLTGLLSKLRGTPQAKIDAAFAGADLSRFAAKDADAQLAEMVARAKALPGRSVIFLEAPTAAGKSTLAKSLEGGLGKRIRSLEVDRYFKPGKDVPHASDGTPDFDRPDALYLDRVAADIKTLLSGGRIQVPRHDMATETTVFESGDYMTLGPDEVLIIDSIFASHPLLRAAVEGHSSLNVYLDAPAVVRLARRLARDKVTRGKPVVDNLAGWAHILGNEASFITPMKAQADLVVNLIKPEELNALKDAYAKLLAEEKAAGRGAEAEKLLTEMIRASLQADGVPAK